MKLKTRKKLVTILKLIATICVVPLVFSTFFNGYTVVSYGTQTNNPVGVSIFEFVAQNNLLLALAFVCMVLEVIMIVFVIFYGMTQTIKKTPNKLVGVITASFCIALSIIPFTMMLIFCSKYSVVGLKYTIGMCPILYFVCGILFGGLMMASYLIPTKKQPKKAVQKPVVELEKVDNENAVETEKVDNAIKE